MTETTTKTQWKKAKRHQITLPSGVQVEIEVPNLAVLMKTGQIPNDLMEVATKQVQQEQISVELVTKLADFQRYLVSFMVKEPAVTPEEVEDLPAEDIDLLQRIANRETDMDAVGHQLGGLETTDEWRSFRGQRLSLADLAGLA